MESKTAEQKVEDIGNYFDEISIKFVQEFEKKGIKKHTDIILDYFSNKDLSKFSILELGCGVGGLLFKFLDLGSEHVFGVDLSEKMIENAKLVAESKNYSDRSDFFIGDFNSVRTDILPINQADVVLADRVLCCSPVALEILKNMIGFNPKYIVLVQPRKSPFYKSFLYFRVKIINFRYKVKDHGAENPYVAVKEYDKLCKENGYKRVLQKFRYAWEIVIYENVKYNQET